MSNVADLFNVPQSPLEWRQWTFANMDSHRLIVLGLQQMFPGQMFNVYALDPLPEADTSSWLLRHQLMHNQMDPPLKIAGNDYTGINFNDPLSLVYLFRLHANEHIQAHTALRITG